MHPKCPRWGFRGAQETKGPSIKPSCSCDTQRGLIYYAEERGADAKPQRTDIDSAKSHLRILERAIRQKEGKGRELNLKFFGRKTEKHRGVSSSAMLFPHVEASCGLM